MYILASHGKYAQQTLASCELITGKLNNFATISFVDPMSVADVVQNYENIYKQNTDSNTPTTIIVDIPNGTPANAANLFISKHPDVNLYAGLSLMLVLAIATGTNIDEAVSQAKELTGNVARQTHKFTKTATNIPKNSGNPLINVRIDARLIHGQVATMWTRSLNATRIMIVDDQIVTSKVQKTTLKTAVPAGVHLSILTVQGAADRIKQGKYAGQRVFLIVRQPQTLLALTEHGVKFAEINVGNMSMSEGARQVAKSVAVTAEDVTTFTKLANQGIKLYHQMVPNDQQTDFIPLLKKED